MTPLSSSIGAHIVSVAVDDGRGAFIYGFHGEVQGASFCDHYDTDPNIQVSSPAPQWQVQTWDEANSRINFAWRRENLTSQGAAHYWHIGDVEPRIPGFEFNWRLTFSHLEKFASTGAYQLSGFSGIPKGTTDQKKIRLLYSWDTDHGNFRKVRGEFHDGTTLYSTSWISVSVNVDMYTRIYIDPDTNLGVITVGSTTETVDIVDANNFFGLYDYLSIPSSGGTSGNEGMNESYATGYIYDTCVDFFLFGLTSHHSAMILTHGVSYQPAYIVNFIESDIDEIFSFIHGVGSAHQTTIVYLQGEESASDIDLFVAGTGETIFDSHQLYLSTINISLDNHLSFVMSALPIVDFQYVFLNGAEPQNIYGAIRFDKTQSQMIQFNDNGYYPSLDQLSINCWVRFNSGAGALYEVIFQKRFGASNRSFALYKSIVSNKIHFGVNTGTWTAANSIADYTIDEWFMATMVYDGLSCKFYMNGVFDSSFPAGGAIVQNSTDPLYIAFKHDGGNYTTMDFADLTMWDRALTDEEVADLYHETAITDFQYAFIDGDTPGNVDGAHYLHITSNIDFDNPFEIESGHSCVITGGVEVGDQPIYLVGSPINTDTYDTEIILDNFKSEIFDVAIRFVVQGERARRFQDADVVYPITRARYRDLPNAYYPDMPGRDFAIQLVFMHSGWAVDTPNGDLSGTHPEVGPRVLHAVIPGIAFNGGYMDGFIMGDFTPASDSHSAFIFGTPEYSHPAYIVSREIGEEIPHAQLCYIGAPISEINGSRAIFITGLDQISPSHNSYVVANTIVGGFKMAHIVSEDIPDVESQKMAYMRAAVLVERSHPLYMKAHLFGFDDFIMCFVHTQPTVEDSQGAFIEAAIPFFNTEPLMFFIKPRDIATDTKLCHISSDINIIDGHNLFIQGRRPFESSRNAYIVNIIITQITDSQRSYVFAPTIMTDSTLCFLNGGAVEPQHMAFIFNSDTILRFKRAYLVGAPATDTQSAYLTA